jgi:NDP-sugar pyrophosphorylase family protein
VQLYEHDGHRPRIDESVRIAPTAVIVGDVTIGPGCSVGFGAVIVAESGAVRIGAHCVIMDTAVLRGTRKDKLILGDHILVGSRAAKSRTACAWPQVPRSSTGLASAPAPRCALTASCICGLGWSLMRWCRRVGSRLVIRPSSSTRNAR